MAPLIIPCIYQYLCQDLRDFALQVKLGVDEVERVLNSPLRYLQRERKMSQGIWENEKKLFLGMQMYTAQKNSSKVSKRGE